MGKKDKIYSSYESNFVFEGSFTVTFNFWFYQKSIELNY